MLWDNKQHAYLFPSPRKSKNYTTAEFRLQMVALSADFVILLIVLKATSLLRGLLSTTRELSERLQVAAQPARVDAAFWMQQLFGYSRTF